MKVNAVSNATNNDEFDEELSDLSSAEDFLEHFGIEFEPSIVHVNRLHILQRFHDYLAKADLSAALTIESRRATYRQLLNQAYLDFVQSNALTEKVFKVFHEAQGPLVQLSIS